MTSPAHDASDQAARWILRREEPGWSGRDEAEFARWLEDAPLNRVAYLRLRTGWRAADRIGALGPIPDEDRGRSAHVRQGRWQPWAIAASLLFLVGGSAFMFSDMPSQLTPQTFGTAVGSRQQVVLADRSRVELNTATHMRATVSAAHREVWLDRGEAFFDISRNERAPFVVHVGTRTVTVLGTKFAVRRDGANMTVSVLEGRVRVDDARDRRAIRSTTISAGDVAVVRDAATLVAVHATSRVESALVWREGMLDFDDARLVDAAREFNRYHHRQIVVTGSSAANMRIDGAFRAENIDAFVNLLRDAYGLRITEDAGTIKISDR
jgi:transmembrane sensor